MATFNDSDYNIIIATNSTFRRNNVIVEGYNNIIYGTNVIDEGYNNEIRNPHHIPVKLY